MTTATATATPSEKEYGQHQISSGEEKDGRLRQGDEGDNVDE
jgi:hypothetical protein